MLDRRLFLQSSAAAMLASHSLTAIGADSPSDSLKGRLFKTLKIGMVRVEGSLTDQFKAARAAGFEAIEMNAPGMDVAETRKAIADSELPVDGTVNSSHWNVRHTDPDPEVRAKALESLQQAIRDTHAVGGSTVLLVVGRGSDGPEEEIWPRSVENISKALPVAARYGITLALENVWNQFLYDHEGDHNQTADKWKQYVDEFNSPLVGMQFDIGNHWKYGSMGDWIRTLGKRIVKLDVKGFSRKENKFTKIGEGDLDFADVRKALREINFYGFCAAEVAGGGPERLKEISDNMDRVFALA
jgi:L-ribulose-5-phosphate 3-epimerase